MVTKTFRFLKIGIVSFFMIITSNSFSQKIGVFDGQTDVGKVLHKGNAVYNSSSQDYSVSGSGSNIWFTKDEFHFVWKKMKGDFILRARGKFLGKGVEEHRKYGWMVRQNLDTSSKMVAATIHGNGLTSLQYREAPHTNVEEKQFEIRGAGCSSTGKKGRYLYHVCCSLWRYICFAGNF